MGVYSGPAPLQVLFNQTSVKNVNNTASEISFIGTGIGSMTLPANFWTVGKKIELKTKGTYQTPTNPGSVTIKIKLGTVTLATENVAATLLATGSTTRELFGECNITCYSTGTTGTVVCDGYLTFEIATGATTVPFSTAASVAGGTVTATSGSTTNGAGFATVTIDTTVAALLDGTETWSNAQNPQGTTLTQVTLRSEYPAGQ